MRGVKRLRFYFWIYSMEIPENVYLIKIWTSIYREQFTTRGFLGVKIGCFLIFQNAWILTYLFQIFKIKITVKWLFIENNDYAK